MITRWIFLAVGVIAVAALVCLTGRSHIALALALDDPTEDDKSISPAEVLETLKTTRNREDQDELLDTYNALTRERAV